MKVKFAHILFEQSGTFKRAFGSLGIEAIDYDICNDFGETDIRIDLFAQIENAFAGKISIFDDFTPDDILLAFFPCTYFCEYNVMFFSGTCIQMQEHANTAKIESILVRAQERHDYYTTLLKLCHVCESRGLRLIIENPYNPHHYLRYNFPYKPAVIDMNRRLSGDYYKKPTQYIFVNCAPAGKKSIQLDKPMKYVNMQSLVNRSMISDDYAYNFICDHILGKESGHTMPTLF